MKSTFVPAPPAPQFPCFRQWIKNDNFKGGVVLFTSTTSYMVLFVPEPLDDGFPCLRQVGEVLEGNSAVSFDNHKCWAPVTGTLTLTIS